MAIRAINVFLFLFNIAITTLLIYFLWSNRWPPIKEADGIEYKDFISILLTALGVMIAAATILIATAAIWGFAVLREEARSSAERTAAKVAREVAESVTASERTDTSPQEAEEIAKAMREGGPYEF
jgi:hypothetical protein